jgi:hypothetical protein
LAATKIFAAHKETKRLHCGAAFGRNQNLRGAQRNKTFALRTKNMAGQKH